MLPLTSMTNSTHPVSILEYAHKVLPLPVEVFTSFIVRENSSMWTASESHVFPIIFMHLDLN